MKSRPFRPLKRGRRQSPEPRALSAGRPTMQPLQRFRTLLDHANDIILFVHLESRRIVDANVSACRHLRCPGGSLVGMPIEKVVDFSRLQWPDQMGDGPECRTISTVLQRLDGVEVPVEMLFCLDEFDGTAYAVIVARDISERLRAEEALRQSEERFRSIVDSTPLGVHLYRLEEGGRLVFAGANPAADAILGVDNGQFVGLPLEEAFPALAVTEIPERYRRACALGEPWTGDQVVYEDRRVRGAYQVHAFKTGPGMMASIFMDITERKRAEETLRESDRMKSEFISTAAHELRTPLTSILGFSQVLLADEQLPPNERREFLGYIHQQANALSGIVADLLDISRIESGQGLALTRVGCTAGELVGQLAPLIMKTADAERFEIVLADEATPLFIDTWKMVRVFENLLSNALKYSPPRSPVRIAGAPDAEGYQFSVADRGIGMNPRQVARVFDKFYRADASNTATGGLGLGMSIVRNIVEAHGGRIWVESAPGAGTTVRFTLPLRQGEAAGEEGGA